MEQTNIYHVLLFVLYEIRCELWGFFFFFFRFSFNHYKQKFQLKIGQNSLYCSSKDVAITSYKWVGVQQWRILRLWDGKRPSNDVYAYLNQSILSVRSGKKKILCVLPIILKVLRNLLSNLVKWYHQRVKEKIDKHDRKYIK